MPGRKRKPTHLHLVEGTLIEVMLDAEVITTRGTLSAIRQKALGQG